MNRMVFQNFLHDVRVGFRIAARDRHSSLLMIGSLGLALGACAVVFSLIDAILFRPLPAISDPSALVAIYGDDRSTAKIDYQSIAYPDYLNYRQRLENLSDLTVYARFPVTLTLADEAQRVTGELVEPNYFSLLGVRLQLGTQLALEYTGPSVPVAVISDRLWRTRFGRDPQVLGKSIRINELNSRIVGVAPAEFGGVLLDWYGRADIWLPMHLEPVLWKTNLLSLQVPWLMCLGRLHPGCSIEQVRVGVQACARDLEAAFPETNRNRGAILLPADQARFYPGRRKAVASVLILLFGGSLALLLVACFNAAGLLLARGERRGPELVVRMALGARRLRLVTQLIAESLVIVGAADALALAFAAVATRYLPAIAPMFHLDFDTRLDGRILVTLLFVTLLTVLACGLYPAFRSSSLSLANSLKSRSSGQANTFGVRRTVIVCQVSLSVVVLLTAGLFLAQFRDLQRIDPGFDPEGVQVTRLDAQAVPENQREGLYRQLLEFARALPGVDAACLAGQEPLSGVVRQTSVRASSPPFDEKRMAFEEVSKDYFRLLRLPLLRGRGFESDSNAREVVVNEVLAAERWSGQNAVGRTLLLGKEQAAYVVVGVCRASKTIDLTEPARPFFYTPRTTSSFPEMVLLTRSSLPLNDLLAHVRGKIRRDLRGLALLDSSPLDQMIAARLSVEKTLAVWTLGVAALALFLVVSGLVGVLSLFVSQRSREMAIRLALGASPFNLSRWVLRQGFVLSLMGMAAGFAVFFSLQDYLSVYLTAIPSSRLVTYSIAGGVILAGCALACLIPALRVLKIDPGQALRSE